MRSLLSSLFLIATALITLPAARGQSLLENGDFDNPTDPLKGWITDYAWSGNSHYIGNKDHISIVTEGARKNIVKFDTTSDVGAGVKMECRAFPFEPGFKYVCNLDVKGGPYRLYFAGYQWNPGVHPHDKPELGELRMIYQSKATVGSSPAWKKETVALPGIPPTPQMIEHLKKIHFLTIYVWLEKAGFVDNVTLTKVADPSMNLP